MVWREIATYLRKERRPLKYLEVVGSIPTFHSCFFFIKFGCPQSAPKERQVGQKDSVENGNIYVNYDCIGDWHAPSFSVVHGANPSMHQPPHCLGDTQSTTLCYISDFARQRRGTALTLVRHKKLHIETVPTLRTTTAAGHFGGCSVWTTLCPGIASRCR